MPNKFISDLYIPDQVTEKEIDSEVKSLKQRNWLLSIIFFGLAAFFIIIEISMPAILCLVIGNIYFLIWRLPKWKKMPRVNKKSIRLEITTDVVIVGNQKISKNQFNRIKIDLISYEGQSNRGLYPKYMYSNGTNNHIRYYANGKEYKNNFCIYNYHHYIKLKRVLSEANIEFSDKISWV